MNVAPPVEGFMNVAPPVEGFMNAASPGVIALFQPDAYYGDHETYLYALADAMRVEYEAIVAAGFVLQLDSPDLGLGRHMMFKGRPDAEYERLASIHVEAPTTQCETSAQTACGYTFAGATTKDPIPTMRQCPKYCPSR